MKNDLDKYGPASEMDLLTRVALEIFTSGAVGIDEIRLCTKAWDYADTFIDAGNRYRAEQLEGLKEERRKRKGLCAEREGSKAPQWKGSR